MKRDANDVTVPGVEGDVRIQRLAHGFPRITAKEEVDLSYGLGYAHAVTGRCRCGYSNSSVTVKPLSV